MIILGVETSCDETALSIIESENGTDITALADKTLSQAKLHEQYGGVFPNLAKREHLKNLPVMLAPLLAEAGLSDKNQLVDAIAVTVGPGLEPCLWTGIAFAEELAKKWEVPVVPVNHMEGHIFSALLRAEESPNNQFPISKQIQNSNVQIINATRYTLHAPLFPALALLISGGHTELVLIKGTHDYEIIGQTRDDAVGEAFDKVARLLGLPYPGGPEISRLAEQRRELKAKSEKLKVEDIRLPRPMLHSDDFDFSFSGLKTAVLYLLKRIGIPDETAKAAIAREFEDAVTEVLIAKTGKAIEQHGAQVLLIGGGVIANTHIRRAFERLATEANVPLFIPEPNLTTDNALMIAVAGLVRLVRGERTETMNLQAQGNLRLGEKI